MFRPTRHLLYGQGVSSNVLLPCFGGCIKEERAVEQAAAYGFRLLPALPAMGCSREPPLSLGAWFFHADANGCLNQASWLGCVRDKTSNGQLRCYVGEDRLKRESRVVDFEERLGWLVA
jgi:hypothetical protein